MNPIKPKEVITPKQCPKGYKWEYRGRGWVATNAVYCCVTDSGNVAYPPDHTPTDTNGENEYHYFELVKDDPMTVTFKVIPWKEWKKNTVNTIKQMVTNDELPIMELIEAPKLDPEDIKDFCEHFAFSNVFEDNVFVEHCEDPTYVWFLNNDKVILIKKP